MAKRKKKNQDKAERPGRTRVSAEESLKRMEEFNKRKEQFIAAVRQGKDQGVSA